MPDRPGEPGPDVTKARVNRTSSSEAPSGGPKRPGPAADKNASPNGSSGPRTRTRTRTTSTARANQPGSSGGAGSSERRSAESPDRGARPPKAKRRGASKASGPVPSQAPAPRAAAAGAVPDLTTDPTTEITGLDQGERPAPPRGRARRRSTSAETGARSAAAPDVVAEAEPLDEAPAKRPRTAPAARRGRRVKRVVRRIELWSVLKLSIVLYTCMYLAILLTVVVLWGLAYSTGQIDNIETFMGEVGLDNYRFYGDRMFKAVAAIGAVAVLAGTVLTVLWAALVNIISEITGGIRVVVIEEEPVRRTR